MGRHEYAESFWDSRFGEPELIGDYVEIACYNGPESHVVVGSVMAIKSLEQFVASERGAMRTKKLRVTHRFHCEGSKKV